MWLALVEQSQIVVTITVTFFDNQKIAIRAPHQSLFSIRKLPFYHYNRGVSFSKFSNRSKWFVNGSIEATFLLSQLWKVLLVIEFELLVLNVFILISFRGSQSLTGDFYKSRLIIDFRLFRVSQRFSIVEMLIV